VGNLVAEEDADKGNEVKPNRAEESVHEQVAQTGTLVASRGSPLEVDVDVLRSLVDSVEHRAIVFYVFFAEGVRVIYVLVLFLLFFVLFELVFSNLLVGHY